MVWDFTQDYDLRADWDKSVKEAKVIKGRPGKIVLIKSFGNQHVLFKYKQEKRPEKTSLAILETNSFWLKGGGGSWIYLPKDGGTNWTQTNTIILRKGMLGAFALSFIFQLFKWNTERAMKRAKKIIEEL